MMKIRCSRLGQILVALRGKVKMTKIHENDRKIEVNFDLLIDFWRGSKCDKDENTSSGRFGQIWWNEKIAYILTTFWRSNFRHFWEHIDIPLVVLRGSEKGTSKSDPKVDPILTPLFEVWEEGQKTSHQSRHFWGSGQSRFRRVSRGSKNDEKTWKKWKKLIGHFGTQIDNHVYPHLNRDTVSGGPNFDHF
jgi:hypothetical protein